MSSNVDFNEEPPYFNSEGRFLNAEPPDSLRDISLNQLKLHGNLT